MYKNQRQFARKEIQVEIELSFLEGAARTVISRNISQGGAFLQLQNSEYYPMGEMVTMYFKDPFENNKAISKNAIIVRHDDQGIAVAFVEIDGV